MGVEDSLSLQLLDAKQALAEAQARIVKQEHRIADLVFRAERADEDLRAARQARDEWDAKAHAQAKRAECAEAERDEARRAWHDQSVELTKTLAERDKIRDQRDCYQHDSERYYLESERFLKERDAALADNAALHEVLKCWAPQDHGPTCGTFDGYDCDCVLFTISDDHPGAAYAQEHEALRVVVEDLIDAADNAAPVKFLDRICAVVASAKAVRKAGASDV